MADTHATFNGINIQNMATGGLPALHLGGSVTGGNISARWRNLKFLIDTNISIASDSRVDADAATLYFKTGGAVAVSGTLNLGQAAAPILLQSGNAAPGLSDWSGISYLSGSSGTVTNATFSNAVNGIQCQNAALTVSNSVFSGNTTGFRSLTGCGAKVERSIFSGNSYGVWFDLRCRSQWWLVRLVRLPLSTSPARRSR